ncbi:endospore germination permease [Pontibacillus yanchengensis]|uniref:Endospore germination permease n=2 Tax=Pontibacillus yanchengensis TaxID=462910 RepID=A0ACC7VDS5_9BACI|nr:endospore germination permease [Pontibacillus yanchengensis]MYL35310.1 endospore germination permease [Pontibacillus yanchengensis]MYL52339.1 endospore germination permease [Pontibacillus yanchengensis]
MNSQVKINQRQFGILLMLFVIGTSILLTPGSATDAAKQDGWLGVLLVLPIGLVYLWFLNHISIKYPNCNLLEINERVFGKWLGRVISLSIGVFGMITSATVLYIIGDFMAMNILHSTPTVYVNILFMAVIIMGLLYGIETIARTAEIFVPWILVLLVFIILASLPNINLHHAQPILEEGISPVLSATLFELSNSTLTMFILFIIYPKLVNKNSKKGNTFFRPYAIGIFFITCITFITITVLGDTLTSIQSVPTYMLAKNIQLEGMIERVEVVLAISWILTVFFKLSIYFYGTLQAITYTFQIKNYRLILVPMAIVCICLSLIVYPNVLFASEWDSTTWIAFSITFGGVYPLLLWIVGTIRNRFSKVKKRGKNQ